MNIREALQQQSPSLALQRSAADEIARLDAYLAHPIAQPKVHGCLEAITESILDLGTMTLGKTDAAKMALIEQWMKNLPVIFASHFA